MSSGNTSLIPIEQLFGSGQLFCLPCNSPVGMILQLPHYTDFVGSGAAIGGSFDLKCISVYPIGNFQFSIPETIQQRHLALQRRFAYMHMLHRITFIQSPTQRASLIVRQLSRWLTQEEAQKIPCELIGNLIGVLPKTIEAGWQYYLRNPDVPLSSKSEPTGTVDISSPHRFRYDIRQTSKLPTIANPTVKVSLTS